LSKKEVYKVKFLKNSRAQAALEFLTTYGWAFLVILIMIGALAYFGVLKPSKLLPERCTFGSEIECQDFQITYGDGTNGELKLRLKNNAGAAITVDTWIIESESATQINCGTNPPTGGDPITGQDCVTNWGSGGVCDVSFGSCQARSAGFVAGDKEKVLITLTYHSIKSGTDYQHDIRTNIIS